MILIFGIVIHTLLGAGLRLAFRWHTAAIAAIFAAKELGELKYKIPGSICTFEKNVTIFKELVGNPSVVVQWLLPAAAAWIVAQIQRKLPPPLSRARRPQFFKS